MLFLYQSIRLSSSITGPLLLCCIFITTAALYPIYTIQPVVQPVLQPAVAYTRYNRLSNRFDDRLYCVNGALRARDRTRTTKRTVNSSVKVPWINHVITAGSTTASRIFSVTLPCNFRVALFHVKFYHENITENVYMLWRNFFPRDPRHSRHGKQHVIPRCFP